MLPLAKQALMAKDLSNAASGSSSGTKTESSSGGAAASPSGESVIRPPT
jgi:hypothetical protein